MSRITKQEEDIQRMRGKRHVYLSTACYHELHDQCHSVCTFCRARCSCTCHPVQRRPET